MAYHMCGLEFDEANDEDDGDDAPDEQMMKEPEEHLRQMRPEKVWSVISLCGFEPRKSKVVRSVPLR